MQERLSRPRKQWGQHFLQDRNVARKIVEVSGVGPEDHVVEIGPGRGALTALLCERAEWVSAVEIDRDLVSFLKAQYSRIPNLRIVHGDFLDVDLREMVRRREERMVVVGNVPYGITAPILFKLLDASPWIRQATLMVQAEVADRIVASPGCKQYGILSVLIRYAARPERVLKVSPASFFPRPAVDSTVIRLDFSDPHPRRAGDYEVFRQVVKAGFGKRRKMLRNALQGTPPLFLEATVIERAFEEAGMDRRVRAEDLDLDGFLELSDSIAAMLRRFPRERADLRG